MRRINVVAACVVTLYVLVGCEGRIEPPPPENTPAEVLELIEYSFLARDVTGLERFLTADFVFYFDEDDVGKQVGEYIIPESWTLTDFLSAVSRVFDNAYSVDMSIASANVGEPGTDDTTYTADNVQINFLVMVDAVNGYLAQGFVTFEFAAVYNEKNEKEWLVAAWRDFTAPAGSGGRNITEASFGEILALFYKP